MQLIKTDTTRRGTPRRMIRGGSGLAPVATLYCLWCAHHHRSVMTQTAVVSATVAPSFMSSTRICPGPSSAAVRGTALIVHSLGRTPLLSACLSRNATASACGLAMIVSSDATGPVIGPMFLDLYNSRNMGPILTTTRPRRIVN
ncbi:MAG: hypothetical protein HY983_01890 [Candidatus Magasanikbacteria bacterium]|nr:hypothetical protein [Candidatus Magasanikbacteria bacterium]